MFDITYIRQITLSGAMFGFWFTLDGRALRRIEFACVGVND